MGIKTEKISTITTLSFNITNMTCSSTHEINGRSGRLVMKYISLNNKVVQVDVVAVLRNVELMEEEYRIIDMTISEDSGQLVFKVAGKYKEEYVLYTNAYVT